MDCGSAYTPTAEWSDLITPSATSVSTRPHGGCANQPWNRSSMTLSQTKTNLLAALKDNDNKVIALSGKWGTGKTHLWSEIQKNSEDEEVKKAVSVSLFGVNDVRALKIKFAQALAPQLGKPGKHDETIRSAAKGITKLIDSFFPVSESIAEMFQAVMPYVLNERFLVIDDIERKHEDLNIDEVLGFIDECVQKQDCRVLLILNSDKLNEASTWQLYHEKVIDQELRLETSPDEAFDIAVRLTPTPFAEDLRKAVSACRVNNIRIIRKIIKATNNLLGRRATLPRHVLNRTVPSIALLGAIHFQGIEDGPNVDFVLNFNSHMKDIAWRNAADTPETQAITQNHERWRLILDKLGIRGTDNFEVLVADYLKSGLLDATVLNGVVERLIHEGKELSARDRAYALFERGNWCPDIPESQILAEIRSLLPDIGFIDMYTVTSLHFIASRLKDGEEVGNQLIDQWIAAFRDVQETDRAAKLTSSHNFFQRKVHPDIEKEVRRQLALQQKEITVLEVCRSISEKQGWGQPEIDLMSTITASEYEAAIVSATGPDLKILLLQSIDFVKNPTLYGVFTKNGANAFVEACRAIVQRDPNSRRAHLLREVFSDAGMQSRLDPCDSPEEPSP